MGGGGRLGGGCGVYVCVAASGGSGQKQSALALLV